MEVQIVLESRDEDIDCLRDMAGRRAKFATRRLMWLVSRAELTLSNTAGTYGAPEKRCQARLQTDAAGVVIATSVARDWRIAVDNALTCAVRRLIRQWRRT